MANFKKGDIVYHKATLKRGIILEVEEAAVEVRYRVMWDIGQVVNHADFELWTEDEYLEWAKAFKRKS